MFKKIILYGLSEIFFLLEGGNAVPFQDSYFDYLAIDSKRERRLYPEWTQSLDEEGLRDTCAFSRHQILDRHFCGSGLAAFSLI